MGERCPSVLAPTQHNVLVGVTKRVAPDDLPAFDRVEFELFESFAIHAYPILFSATKIQPLPRETWLARFPGPVQTNLRKAFESLDSGANNDRKFTRNSIFTKIELGSKPLKHDDRRLEEGIVDGQTESKPRIINASDPAYNVVVGPTIAALQAMIKEKCHPAVKLGTDRAVLGSWFSDGVIGAHIYEADFNTFDATQHERLRRLIVRLYCRFNGISQEVARAMNARIGEKVVYAPQGVRLKYSGTMATGDPDTYISNTITNALIQAYVHCKATGIGLTQLLNREDWSIAVSGDDSVVRRYRKVPAGQLARTIELLGLSAAIKHTQSAAYVGEFVEYCSSVFHPLGSSWWLGLKPGRLFLKTAWLKLPCADPPAQLRANVLGLWAAAVHTPFAREFMRRILQLTADVNVTQEHTLVARKGRGYETATTELKYTDDLPAHCDGAKLWVLNRYNVTWQQFADWERWLAKTELANPRDTHWVSDRVMSVDL
jgi:hypothetical protein